MSESLAFKKRPSLGHGLLLFIYYYLFETDYKTSLSRVESLREAIKISQRMIQTKSRKM